MSGPCPNCASDGGALELRAPPFDADAPLPDFELRRCGACGLVTTRGVDDGMLA